MIYFSKIDNFANKGKVYAKEVGVMSKEAARDFLWKVMTDDWFARLISAAPNDEIREGMVKAHGFDCTKEDIEAVKSELQTYG